MPAQIGARLQLGEQPGLADPGLADELDRRGPAALQPGERLVERVELLGAPDEM